MIDLSQIFETTITGILINIPWFILVIWATRTIARKMPDWIKQYHEDNIKEIMLQRAIGK